MTRAEIAERFPEAAAWCLELRRLFGADARLVYARNGAGEELGRPVRGLTVLARLLVTLELERERAAGARDRDAWIARCRADRRANLTPKGALTP